MKKALKPPGAIHRITVKTYYECSPGIYRKRFYITFGIANLEVFTRNTREVRALHERLLNIRRDLHAHLRGLFKKSSYETAAIELIPLETVLRVPEKRQARKRPGSPGKAPRILTTKRMTNWSWVLTSFIIIGSHS